MSELQREAIPYKDKTLIEKLIEGFLLGFVRGGGLALGAFVVRALLKRQQPQS